MVIFTLMTKNNMYIPTPDEIRLLRGSLSRREFAELLGIDKSRTIEAWERGQNPMWSPVWEYAKILLNHPDRKADVR